MITVGVDYCTLVSPPLTFLLSERETHRRRMRISPGPGILRTTMRDIILTTSRGLWMSVSSWGIVNLSISLSLCRSTLLRAHNCFTSITHQREPFTTRRWRASILGYFDINVSYRWEKDPGVGGAAGGGPREVHREITWTTRRPTSIQIY
ncbi:hypothetical protein PMAYCL1PPCAC_23640, partial [Pristionchus mayeri]